MILTYFLYAFPFFILSVIVLIHINKDSRFFFAKNLWLIAVFALMHGTHELQEMFAGFKEPSGPSLNFADAVTLAVSYFCLIQFGINCIIHCKRLNPRFNLVPLALFVSWIVILFFKQYNFIAGKYGGEGDIFARYILGIPGTFLTAYAFLLQREGLKKTGQARYAVLAAAGFAFYGLLSGLIVPEAGFFPASVLNYAVFYKKTGMPVQLVRAFAGVFIAYNMIQLMRIFEWEAEDSAEKEKEALRQKIKERTRELETATEVIADSLKEKDILLKEKETLLRELYHRTKNNMQLVSSLLGLQATYMGDEKSLRMLRDSQNRIQAMSMVHEKLYQSERLSDVNIREYIEDLVKALLESYSLQQQVALKLDIDDIHFNIDTAITCGLIINELMTNSLKYAFPDGRSGEVSITLHRLEGDEVQLNFADNGMGMPGDFDLKRVKSLGLRLLYNLVTQQLHGNIQLESGHGCRYGMVFELSQK